MGEFFSEEYCSDIFNYERTASREVEIGNLKLGGEHPIRVQSMTDTPTMDTEKTVAQSKRIFDAGAELVRITAPGIRDAKNLNNIREQLHNQWYTKPLVADIHFSPNAAEMAALYVEKVRVNPGNYIDKNTGDQIEFTDQEYALELKKINRNLNPLIQQCKKTGTAIRVGTNHGSLSNRIVGRYGDTPEGMVESTLEFVRAFANEGFHDLVLSLKASNARVMVFANRLLVKRMHDEGFDYPLHLGVTEAGEGEDGRIKSAIGVGTLLVDGIGDTIRVSLTEPPENEIPVAKKIIAHIAKRNATLTGNLPRPTGFSPFEYQRRKTREVANIGGDNPPIVISEINLDQLPNIHNQEPLADFFYLKDVDTYVELSREGKFLIDYNGWKKFYNEKEHCFPVLNKEAYKKENLPKGIFKFIKIHYYDLDENFIENIINDPQVILLAESKSNNWIGEQRAMVFRLMEAACKAPIIPLNSYDYQQEVDFQIASGIDFGPLCIDGLVDGISLKSAGGLSNKFVVATAFGVLQASRLRMSKTEYISCPGCGRTLFSLQETTRKIRERTAHLKGLKIGVMGCIVNGPGEMADADFGYVGAGPGKISLYRNKELVRKNIPEAEAVDALVQLIKDNGRWVEQ